MVRPLLGLFVAFILVVLVFRDDQTDVRNGHHDSGDSKDINMGWMRSNLVSMSKEFSKPSRAVPTASQAVAVAAVAVATASQEKTAAAGHSGENHL